MKSTRLATALVLAALIAAPATAAPNGTPAPATDGLYDTWDRLLRTHVDEEGLVDYAALKGAGFADLKAFMEALAATDPSGFASEAERKVFWINAYNAVVIWQVVERYPIDSVRDVGPLWGLIGGFFKQKYPIAGVQMSADNIEHDTLRAQFKDARIHWALVCAAFGCPRLLSRAYQPETLEATLTERAYEFLSTPRGVQLERDTRTLYVSSYFDWYEGDFEAESGTILDYVLRYTSEDDAAWIRANRDDLRVRIMDYDWTLNSQQNGPRSGRAVPR